MTAKPVSSMSADELWGALLGRDPATYCIVHDNARGNHSACTVILCPYCASPVTNGQINDGDAFPIDERGPDDGKYAHRECAQGARYEP